MVWSNFNADDGNSIRPANISVLGPDALKVEGCVAAPALRGGEPGPIAAEQLRK